MAVQAEREIYAVISRARYGLTTETEVYASITLMLCDIIA